MKKIKEKPKKEKDTAENDEKVWTYIMPILSGATDKASQ